MYKFKNNGCNNETKPLQTNSDAQFQNKLFHKNRTVIGRHISIIFKEGELDKEVVYAKITHTTQH